MAEYNRKYREENKEKERERHRKYREENKEKLVKTHQKYYRKNKEKYTAYYQRYRKKKEKVEACKIIREHHESLKDDPDRLTTEFIRDLIGVDCQEGPQ